MTGLLTRFKRRINFLRHGKHVVLVYTMGKVGSASIKASSDKHYPYIPSFHIHFLSKKWIEDLLPKMNAFFHGNIRTAKYVSNFLKEFPDYRLKIITLVRDPLSRDISDIFQNWEGRVAPGKTIEDFTYEQLTKELNNSDHSYTLNWFDSEFKEYTGFDFYEHPFDKEKGYSIYSTDKADILCIQLEKLDAVMEAATRKFLGYGIPAVKGVNTTDDKRGSDLYKRLMKEYKADASKLELVYDSKFVRHFYSPEQTAKFKSRWS